MARRLKNYDSIAGICEAGVAPFGGLIEQGGKLKYVAAEARRMYRSLTGANVGDALEAVAEMVDEMRLTQPERSATKRLIRGEAPR